MCPSYWAHSTESLCSSTRQEPPFCATPERPVQQQGHRTAKKKINKNIYINKNRSIQTYHKLLKAKIKGKNLESNERETTLTSRNISEDGSRFRSLKHGVRGKQSSTYFLCLKSSWELWHLCPARLPFRKEKGWRHSQKKESWKAVTSKFTAPSFSLNQINVMAFKSRVCFYSLIFENARKGIFYSQYWLST